MNKMPLPISGFPERLPAQRIAELAMTETIRRQYELAGFAPLETPAVERLEVLTAKGGIQRQIYQLTRPAADGKDSAHALGLHFDLTVPLARYVVQHASGLTFPLRRWQHQKVWRGERPQHGRAREFAQFDIDIVGRGQLDELHDAEVLATMSQALDAIGLSRAVVHVSHRRILEALTGHFGVAAAPVLQQVDKLARDGLEVVLGRVAELDGPAGLTGAVRDLLRCATLDEAERLLARVGADVDGVHALRRIVLAAGELGAEGMLVDLSIARGLDYYTGLVVETLVPGHEQWGSICSGGRYDNLAAHFGNQRYPGVGVSIGVTRLFDLLVESGDVQAHRASPAAVLVTTQDRDLRLHDYLAIARSLRAAGHRTELYLEPRPLREQLADAAAKGIPLVVVAGERELDARAVALRDMTRRTQVDVPLADLPSVVTDVLHSHTEE
jgi:histidyl-tRNA synthetase